MTGVNGFHVPPSIHLGLLAPRPATIIHGEQERQGNDSWKPQSLSILLSRSSLEWRSLNTRSMISLTLKKSSSNVTEPENLTSMSWTKVTIRKVSINWSGIRSTHIPSSRSEQENGNASLVITGRGSLSRLTLKYIIKGTRWKPHSLSWKGNTECLSKPESSGSRLRRSKWKWSSITSQEWCFVLSSLCYWGILQSLIFFLV